VILLALVVLPLAAAQAPSAELQVLASGHFVLVEPHAVYEPRLDAAVEQGMASLPFIVKPLARLRLKPAVYETVCPELSLQLDGERLYLSCGGEQAPFHRRLDGSDGPIMDDGDAYQVVINLQEHSVGLRFAGDKGGQANRYDFEADGGMVLHATIFSPYLPDDLSWTLRYRRVGEPLEPAGDG
jgi:hypothetical protein